MKRDEFLTMEREAEMETPLRANETAAAPEVTLKGVRPNIVQSIRAFRVQDLQDAARSLGHHFLYANLANAQSKQDVLDLIAQQFILPAHFGKNFDALYDCMTDPVHKSGPQPGFIVVLESIPTNPKFDKEAREQLLDIFRDTAEYWAERKVPFRCFYSFSVARTANAPVEKGTEAVGAEHPAATADNGEKMPTDKLVDVSPLALRMSSPFNAGYWLAAA
jgi:RNAse (barnase) inhibitor barstar